MAFRSNINDILEGNDIALRGLGAGLNGLPHPNPDAGTTADEKVPVFANGWRGTAAPRRSPACPEANPDTPAHRTTVPA
jgi:hypothetical protein